MAPRKDLAHRRIEFLAPYYDTFTNPITPSQELRIISGSNILVNRTGQIQRMPGSNKYETTATDFNDGERVFVYRKWNGDTFLIANAVTGTQSIVYKLKIGTDAAFVSLFTSSSNVPFDFAVSNDYLFFSNGTDAKKYNGNSPTEWGINVYELAVTTTGPNSPATAADQGSAWSNVNNVFSSNDARATASVAAPGGFGGGGANTSVLRATNFSFAIGAADSIVGIKVEVEASSSGANDILEALLVVNGANLGSYKFQLLTGSEAYLTFGGSTDTWSAGLTPSQVNDTTFGVDLSVSDESGSVAPSLDHVRITLYSVTPAASTSSTGSTGITATVGWRYAYCYKNSGTGHLSSISPYSLSTGAVNNKTVTVTGPRNTDSQVDYVSVFRTLDGAFDDQGNGTYYYVGDVANPGSGTWSYADTTADSALDTTLGSQAPLPNYNDPPVGLRGLKSYANRIWGFVDNVLYYSGWEEITNGVEEECFPSGVTGNLWYADSEIMALGVLPEALLILTRNTVFKVTGDTRDTFQFLPLFKGMGTHVKVTGVAEDSDRVFWMNNDGQIWATDGFSKSFVSEPVTSDLLNIASTDCSMVVHRYGQAQWLVVADNNGDTTAANGAKWYVLNLATGRWMPPWSRSATHMHSGELSTGQVSLLYMSFDGGSAGNTIVRGVSISPNTEDWADTGIGNNAANMVLAPLKLSPDGFVSELVYVGYEKDLQSTPAADPTVSYVTDEIATGAEASATQVDPPLRRTSATIQEKWANVAQGDTKHLGTRTLVKFAWSAENKNFKLLSLDYAYRVVGGQD